MYFLHLIQVKNSGKKKKGRHWQFSHSSAGWIDCSSIRNITLCIMKMRSFKSHFFLIEKFYKAFHTPNNFFLHNQYSFKKQKLLSGLYCSKMRVPTILCNKKKKNHFRITLYWNHLAAKFFQRTCNSVTATITRLRHYIVHFC